MEIQVGKQSLAFAEAWRKRVHLGEQVVTVWGSKP